MIFVILEYVQASLSISRAAFGASRTGFGPRSGVRAHRRPGGRHARIIGGGAVIISLAILTKFHAATTY